MPMTTTDTDEGDASEFEATPPSDSGELPNDDPADLNPELPAANDNTASPRPKYKVPAPGKSTDAPVDDKARKENALLSNKRDLKNEANEHFHDLVESVRDIFFCAVKGILIIVSCITVVAIVFWSWHLLMPSEFWFLTQEQLSKIQTLLTTVAVSGLVGGLAKRVAGPGGDNTR